MTKYSGGAYALISLTLVSLTVFSLGLSTHTAERPSGVTREITSTLTVANGEVVITVPSGIVSISTSTLATLVSRGASRMTASAASTTELGTPTAVTATAKSSTAKSSLAKSASWSYPSAGIDVTVGVTPKQDGVVVSMTSRNTTSITWPISSVDSSVTSVEYANGSGQSIPIRDAFWNSPSSGLLSGPRNFAGDLTLPAWGVTGSAPHTGVAFYTQTDIGTALDFSSTAGTISAATTHSFDLSTAGYRVVITPTDGSPTAAAAPYREYLIATGQFRTLSAKIAANPETARLLGAYQAYVWGDGRDPAMIASLKKLGISKMWLGYDGDTVSAQFVTAAAGAGYLVAPYDSWDNAQDPSVSDAATSTWPGSIWSDGCVHDANGARETGFGGRGCYVSTLALKQAEKSSHVLTDRVTAFTATGASSYFLDVDAAGQLFQDYSPGHSQTMAGDRAIRLDRMTTLARGAFSAGKPLVLGSESAAAWANSALSYTQGASTSTYDALWKTERSAATWGGYWPASRPAIFFRPAALPADLAKAMFDPKYAVPLYQSVLHDSIISTDRWELSYFKLPALEKSRALTAMLYNEPLNFVLDGAEIAAHGTEIARLQAFFSVLQKAAGTKPLTSFRFLTADHAVQQSEFGSGALTVTANFGTTRSHGVDAGCVRQSHPHSTPTVVCMR